MALNHLLINDKEVYEKMEKYVMDYEIDHEGNEEAAHGFYAYWTMD